MLQLLSYSLVAGVGSADNSSFDIVGSTLRIAVPLNYEQRSSYAIRLRVTDSGGLAVEGQFSITVTNVNEPPTDIALSAASIQENLSLGTTIALLSSVDPDVNSTFTYSLINGIGSTDNSAFAITNGQLLTAASFDFENKSSYSIRLRSTDQGGLTCEKQFTINVINSPEAPTFLALSGSQIAENQPLSTLIGVFNTIDSDIGDSFTYSLVTGAGDADNSLFAISNDQLLATVTFDFESRTGYAIRVRTTDQTGLAIDRQLTISILNVNESPTDLNLTSTSISENQPIGTLVGTLAAVDIDAADAFGYALVGGPGSEDNHRFQIVSGQLHTAALLDYETKSSYQVRVRTTDLAGLTFEKQFTIAVLDTNDAPTTLSLSAASINENQAAGTVIGTLSTSDQDANQSFTFALVNGLGSTDNSGFTIANSQLIAAVSFDYETKSHHSIRVRVTDTDGLWFEAQFNITVLNVNESPAGLTLSNTSLPETAPTGSQIGALSATDPDIGDTLSYSLVAGVGSADNSSFDIVGSTLRIAVPLNYEQRGSYSVRVRATDSGGISIERQFSITVTNVNEPPTDIALSAASIQENLPLGATVALLSSVDPDANNSFTYSLINGLGGIDNSAFTITNGQLLTATNFDFENKSSYSIRLRSTDQGGLTCEKQFTINVTNAPEAPTFLALSSNQIGENQPVAALIGIFSTTDSDIGDSFIYSLVTGAGDADNSLFTISNERLLATVTFDFESRTDYAIRVRTTDQTGLAIDRPLTIGIVNVNESPTDLHLSSTSINENQPIGTLVGTFAAVDVDAADAFGYAFVGGPGSEDNQRFQIVSGQLQTVAVLDFEAKNSYQVRVRTTDLAGLTFEKQFIVAVTNANDAPTNFTLSTTSIKENQGSQAFVAKLTASDQDVGDRFSYSLVDGLGSVDNAAFIISDSQLLTAFSFDYESKSSYSIRIRSTDQGGLSVERQISISVSNLNEPPSQLFLSSVSIAENQPSGVPIGGLSALDPDFGDSTTYMFVVGVGSADNDLFSIYNNQLLSQSGLDFESDNNLEVRIRATDRSGLMLERALSIEVLDVNEVPTIMPDQMFEIGENSPLGVIVGTVLSTDQDLATPFNSRNFAIIGGNGDGAFEVDPLTGQISVSNSAALNFESNSHFALQIGLVDGGGAVAVPTPVTVWLTEINEVPTISNIGNQSIVEDGQSGALSFNVTDPETPADFLVIQASSSNVDLIPNSNLVLLGDGVGRRLVVLPGPDRSGTAIVTVTVNDGINSSSTSFSVTVVDSNDAPTITPILPQTILEDTSTLPLSFTIGDVDDLLDELEVTVTSSNRTLVDDSHIAIGGVAANRQLVVTPSSNRSGMTVITVVVDDGEKTVLQEFELLVVAVDDPLTISIDPAPLIYRRGSKQAVAIDSTATISDIDTPQLSFEGATLSVSEDSSTAFLSLPKTGMVVRKGKTVKFAGTIIGTSAGGKKGSPLEITFNSTAGQIAVQALLRALTFRSRDKLLGQHSVSIQLATVAGESSNTATRVVTLQ